MKKVNKLSLPAVILIASIIFGGFYYTSQVNKQTFIEKQQQIKIEQEKQDQLVTNKAKCQKDGQQFYDKKKSEVVLDSPYFVTRVLGNQSYSFNQLLNTCLVAWEDLDINKINGVAIHIRHITDIYSNSDVYSWWQKSLTSSNNPPENSSGNEAEYKQKLQHYGLY